MRKKPSDTFIRAQAVALHQVGLNEVEISKQLKVSRCCIQNAIKKFKTLGQYDDLKRSGCPKKILDRDICHLRCLVKGEALLSAGKIASDLNSCLSAPVSTVTVRRYLQKLAFEYVVKMKK